MINSLYLIGGAGVGKTSLLQELNKDYVTQPAIRLHNLLWGEPLFSENTTGVRLGRPRSSFAGTDALGMAVNPDAVEWLTLGNLPKFICGEGQRLSNQRFLTTLRDVSNLTVICVVNNNSHVMRAQRAHNLGVREQSSSYVKATVTKSANLCSTLTTAGVRVVKLDSTNMGVSEAAISVRQICEN